MVTGCIYITNSFLKKILLIKFSSSQTWNGWIEGLFPLNHLTIYKITDICIYVNKYVKKINIYIYIYIYKVYYKTYLVYVLLFWSSNYCTVYYILILVDERSINALLLVDLSLSTTTHYLRLIVRGNLLVSWHLHASMARGHAIHSEDTLMPPVSHILQDDLTMTH